MTNVKQVIYALDRMVRVLDAQADKLHAAGDYSAEFPAEDANRLREAIVLLAAQPAPVPVEPVAWWDDKAGALSFDKDLLRPGAVPLYTAPPAQPAPVPHRDSGHGHVFPRPDGVRARCGGPRICTICAMDLAAKNAPGATK